MLKKIEPQNILFLDIETVPETEHFDDLSPEKQNLFSQKTHYQRKQDFTPEAFYERAGIWAEFGKVICISIGYFSSFEKQRVFKVKSFSGDDERQVLIAFKEFLEEHYSRPKHLLCAHNGKEFDFPFLARRMIINKITLPEKLNLFGKKPWEVQHLGTLELWKFGDYKHYTSLALLTNILKIPSPKNDMVGSQVAQVYYKEKDLDSIVSYCQGDTIAVAQLLLRFSNMELLSNDEIVIL